MQSKEVALSLSQAAGDSGLSTGAKVEIEVPLQSAAAEVSRKLTQTEKSLRVAVAQIKTDPGKIEANVEKIVKSIEQAKDRGAQLVVFPEAAIPAYCSMDLQYNRAYIDDNIKALEKVKKASQGITTVVGFVDTDLTGKRSGSRPVLYNSAAIIRDGEILGIQDKSLLPTYDIFFEDRYYSPARTGAPIDVAGVKVGTTICEDIWAGAEHYADDPASVLVSQGAELIVNLSASPFHLGKQATRQKIVQQASKQAGVPCIYANLVGGFDGYEGEVIFDGRSLITNASGDVVAMGKAFDEDLVVVDVYKEKELPLIPELSETEELYHALVLGIKDYMRRLAAGGKKAIIGLSGGIDSALVAALAVDALGPDRVLGVTMPSKFNSDDTKGAAYELAENLGIEIRTVPIQNQVDEAIAALHTDEKLRDLSAGVSNENVQARMRMLNLMYYSNKVHGIVLNTGNKTELALNNCTIYGDMVGGFSVLGDVDKDRVYELAKFINTYHGREVIPEFSIITPASAELAANQTDADVMGDDPQTLAPMVRDIIEQDLNVGETKALYGGTFSDDQIMRVFTRLDASEWKRRQASPGIRVTKHAFGNGRKMPMGHGYYK